MDRVLANVFLVVNQRVMHINGVVATSARQRLTFSFFSVPLHPLLISDTPSDLKSRSRLRKAACNRRSWWMILDQEYYELFLASRDWRWSISFFITYRDAFNYHATVASSCVNSLRPCFIKAFKRNVIWWKFILIGKKGAICKKLF